MKLETHYIQIGDNEKEVNVTFSLAELKTMLNTMVEDIERERREENTETYSKIKVAQKLQYIVTDNIDY